jgi:branched-chain amino acid transport system ATP-binding protein
MPTSSGEAQAGPVSSPGVVPARPAPLLIADALEVGYGGPPVIRGVSCQAGPGEIVTVVGPNGAGKSTLLKAIAGNLLITSGSVALRGQEITNVRADRLARLGVGFVPQDSDVFPNLSVTENLEMGGYLLERSRLSERMDAVLDLMPALKKMLTRKAEKLSGGERKMVGIARALMSEPSVLLLDEPTAGLSPQLSTLFLSDHVRRLAQGGTAVVLVEQKALAALEISTWGVLLVNGTLHLECPAPELLARSDIGELFLGRAGGAVARSEEEQSAAAGRAD